MNSKEKDSSSSLNHGEKDPEGGLPLGSIEFESAEFGESTINPGKLNLPKIISFDSIARCGDEVWIESDGKIYRLRKTKQGKLILTK